MLSDMCFIGHLILQITFYAGYDILKWTNY